MQCSKRTFLYQAEVPGVLYVTLDDNHPIYIDFKKMVKLEICLTQSNVKDNILNGALNVNLSSNNDLSLLESQFGVLENMQVKGELINDGNNDRNHENEDVVNSTNVHVTNIKPRKSLRKLETSKCKIKKQKGQNAKKTTEIKIVKKSKKGSDHKRSECSLKKEECSQSEPVSCPLCSLTFSSKLERYKHWFVRKENSHECQVCQKVLKSKIHLILHMKTHSGHEGKGELVCDECGQSFKHKDILRKHLLNHMDEDSFKCCRCQQTFKSKTKWEYHLRYYKHTDGFVCSCCNKVFTTRGELTAHRMATQVISCGICGEVFPNMMGKRIHLRSAHPDQIFRCDFEDCSYVFATEKEFNVHLRRHRKRARKLCTICGQYVVRLNAHLVTHKTKEDMPDSELFFCDQCPAKFKAQRLLKGHLETHTSEHVKCHLCPVVASSRKKLATHMKNVHSGSVFQCEICGKQCSKKTNLKVHMRIHSSSKTYQCHLCQQGFNYNASLKSHLKSKHSLSSEIASTAVPAATSTIVADVTQYLNQNETKEETAQLIELATDHFQFYGSDINEEITPSTVMITNMPQFNEHVDNVDIIPLPIVVTEMQGSQFQLNGNN